MSSEYNSRTNRIVIEDRKEATFSGVLEVLSFDESIIILLTDLGELTIKGSGLKVSQFSNESGGLNISGKINAVGYTDDRKAGGGFVKKLFR